MQEVFEKILEKLESERGRYFLTIANTGEKSLDVAYEKVGETIDKAIEIVKQEAADYKNGWIPCSSGKMPEEHDSIFAKAKGTDKWNDAMFEKTSDAVNVTVSDEKGNTTTTHAHTIDGKWSCDLLKCNKSYQIIAWQPLPEPYQPKGE